MKAAPLLLHPISSSLKAAVRSWLATPTAWVLEADACVGCITSTSPDVPRFFWAGAACDTMTLVVWTDGMRKLFNT